MEELPPTTLLKLLKQVFLPPLRSALTVPLQEIFQRSRNDSQKVLFLITDGFSNGGDPIPLANDLKKAQVKIFTIGIQNGNYRELYDLASSPGEFYSYLLDSFQEFESLARRALHVG